MCLFFVQILSPIVVNRAAYGWLRQQDSSTLYRDTTEYENECEQWRNANVIVHSTLGWLVL